jgi:hypothetical protein
MLAMPSAFLFKESSAEIFARAAIMLLHSITRPVREPASRSDDTKRRQDMTLDWSTYRTAPTGKFSTGASPCFGCRRPWAGPAVAAASLALAPLVPGQHFCAEVPIDDPKVVALCRSTIAPRPSSPTTWNAASEKYPSSDAGFRCRDGYKGTCGGPFVARGGGEKMRIIQFCVFEVVQVAHQ